MLKAARGFNARIVVLGLLPRGDSDPDLVRACNKVLIELCRQEDVQFISLLDKIQEADMDGIASGSVHIIKSGALKILKTFHPMFQEFPAGFISGDGTRSPVCMKVYARRYGVSLGIDLAINPEASPPSRTLDASTDSELPLSPRRALSPRSPPRKKPRFFSPPAGQLRTEELKTSPVSEHNSQYNFIPISPNKVIDISSSESSLNEPFPSPDNSQPVSPMEVVAANVYDTTPEIYENSYPNRDRNDKIVRFDVNRNIRERDWLRIVANRNSLRLVSSRGGGDCLYDSIAQALRNVGVSSVDHCSVRKLVADQFEKYIDHYRTFFQEPTADEISRHLKQRNANSVLARDFEHYVLYTRERNELGNAVSLAAIKDIFPMLRIVLWNSRSNSHLVFNPNGPIDIHIAYYAHCGHYEPMLPLINRNFEIDERIIVELNDRVSSLLHDEYTIPPLIFEGVCRDKDCHVHSFRPTGDNHSGFKTPLPHKGSVGKNGVRNQENTHTNIPAASINVAKPVSVETTTNKGVNDIRSDFLKIYDVNRSSNFNDNQSHYGSYIEYEMPVYVGSGSTENISECDNPYSSTRSNSTVVERQTKRSKKNHYNDEYVQQSHTTTGHFRVSAGRKDYDNPVRGEVDDFSIRRGANIDGRKVYYPWNEGEMKEVIYTKTPIEIPRFVNYESTDHVLSDSVVCENCERASTYLHNIEVSEYQGLRKWRFVGKVLKKPKHLPVTVCRDCRMFLSGTSGFNVAGPSHLWSILTGRNRQKAEELWEDLPQSMRNLWASQKNAFPENIRPSGFRDFTAEVLEAKNLVNENTDVSLNLLYCKYWFWSVRCPAGCCTCMEKVNFISYNHYLDFKYGIKICKSDPKLFVGCRPDFPKIIISEKFSGRFGSQYFCSGFMLHPELGMVILFCENHKKGLKDQFIHEPEHPILKQKQVYDTDSLAPLEVVPLISRRPAAKGYNPKNFVAATVAGYKGVSSMKFSAAESAMFLEVDHNSTVEADSLSLKYRDDLRRTTIARGQSDPRRFGSFRIEYADKISKEANFPTEDEVMKCVEGSSYVDINDTFEMSKLLRERSVRTNYDEDSERSKKTDIARYFLKIIHPSGMYGHIPFDLSSISKACGAVGVIVISLTIHCRPIHISLMNKFSESNDEIIESILFAVQKVAGQLSSSFHSRGFYEGKFRAMLDSVASANNCLTDFYSSRVSKTFANLLPSRVIALEYRDGIFNSDNLSRDIVLIFWSSNRSATRTTSEIPVRINFHSLMAVVSGSAEKPHFHSRWSHLHKFWSHDGSQHERCGSTFELPRDWKILVFSSSKFFRDHTDDLETYLGIQKKVVCRDHSFSETGGQERTAPLVKDSRKSEKFCCEASCRNFATWSCIEGIQFFVECSVGLCERHFKLFSEADENVVYVNHLPEDRITFLRNSRGMAGDDESSRSSSPSHHDICEEIIDDGIDLDVLRENVDESRRMVMDMADSAIEGVYVDDNRKESFYPAHSRLDLPSIYCSRKSIFSHFLLNDMFGVMRRYQGYCPSNTSNRMLHYFATRGNCVVPLLYPTSFLFPNSYFFSDASKSVHGAFPISMFSNWGLPDTCVSKGVASLRDHITVQTRDFVLHSSHSIPRLHFAFDVKLNSSMTGISSGVLCRRGLEIFDCINEKENEINTADTLVCRRAKELSRLLADQEGFDYFLTLTCNVKETPGLKQITESLEDYESDNFFKIKEDLLTLQISESVFYNLQWHRVVEGYMEMLWTNPISPVGRVKELFYRYEYQVQEGLSAGSMAHVHSGIFLYPEHKAVTLNRVCGNSVEMLSKCYNTDFYTLLRDGFVFSRSDFERIREMHRTLQTHSCERASYRCQKRWNKDRTKKVCRYLKHPGSAHPYFEYKGLIFDDETFEILENTGFVHFVPNEDRRFADRMEVDERLKAGVYHYNAYDNEHFIPTIPRVMCFFKSSINALVCERKFSVSYLVPYLVGKEEHPIVNVKTDGQTVKYSVEEQQGKKISNLRYKYNESRQKVKSYDNLLHISLPEMIFFLGGVSYFHCTGEFIHVNTNPPEYRSAVLKGKSQFKNKSDGVHGASSIVEARTRTDIDIPLWRRFTESQILVIEDSMKSLLHPDVVTRFGMRCPELRIFDSLEAFLESFISSQIFDPAIRNTVSEGLREQPWIDGSGRRHRVRFSGIEKAYRYLISQLEYEEWEVAGNAIKSAIFDDLIQLYNTSINLTENERQRKLKEMHPQERDFYERFVDFKSVKNVIAVFSDVHPSKREKFMYHICITLGKFENEAQLFNVAELKEAFLRCKLISSLDCSEDDVNRIMKMYLAKQGLHYPIPQRKLSYYIKTAHRAFSDVLLGNNEYSLGVPPILEASIVENVELCLLHHESDRRINILTAIHDDISKKLEIPALGDFINATIESPLIWEPAICRFEDQSDESFSEQVTALNLCVGQISKFMSPRTRNAKFILFHGPAGSGKTFLLKLALLYCASRGLKFTLMALTSERARTLGGEHIHVQFPLDSRNFSKKHPSSMVNYCVEKLDKDPQRKALLLRVSVIFIEEIGYISSQMYGVIDSVMRRITNNNAPMGGKLVIANGDSRQIPPCDGDPFWTSFHLVTDFKILNLNHFVRSASDPILQRCINVFNKIHLTTSEIETFVKDVISNTQHFESFNEISDRYVRIVSKREAEREATNRYLESKISDENVDVFTFHAVDEVDNGSGSWLETKEKSVVRQLNKHVLEEENLHVFEGAIVRLTYNERGGRVQFSQGQLAIITNIDGDSIRIKVVPPGVRVYDTIEDAWNTISLSRRYSQPVIVCSRLLKGRRKQFPIRHHIACTIHRVQGQTLQNVATKISVTDKNYAIWDRSMLLVLISRTQNLQDLAFVGDKNDTANALREALSIESPWAKHIQERLGALDILTTDAWREITNEFHPYAPRTCTIPDVSSGFVYMLVSGANFHTCYIGETNNLLRRIGEHNTGAGSNFTRRTYLMPWLLLAFVTGFSDEYAEELRRNFETKWQRILRPLDSPDVVYSKGRDLVISYNLSVSNGPGLVLTKCGQIISRDGNEENILMRASDS
jgi:predicted GIY-YIG superfamily endonuclease